MKNKKILFVCAVLLAICIQNAKAQFEYTGSGARATAMGNAFTALADDAFSIYYNPAGLSRISWREIGLDYEKLYAGLKDDSNLYDGSVTGVYHKPGTGTFGLGIHNFSLSGYYMENTFMLSYGGRFFKTKFSQGVNLKILSKSYGKTLYTENAVNLNGGPPRGGKDPVFENGYTKTGFAADIGLLYDFSQHHSIGLTLNNINEPNMGLSSEDIVPMMAKIGYAYRSYEFNIPFDFTIFKKNYTAYAGIERSFMQKMFLRAGAGLGSKEYTNISAGMGWKQNSAFNLDYSFNYPIRGISNTYGTHKITLTLKFGAPDTLIPPPAADLNLEIEKLKTELEDAREEIQKANNMALKSEEDKNRAVKKAEERQQEIERKMRVMLILQKKQDIQRRKIQEAKKQKPDPREKLINLYYSSAESYFNSEEYIPCVEELDKLLKIEPENQSANDMKELAKTNLAIKYKDETERIYTQGLKLYSEDKKTEAISVWEEALKLNPWNDDIKKVVEKAKKEREVTK